MTEVRCNNCDELNDINAIKCETCKASLTNTEPHCSDEEDECEKDFRFIEEAEYTGEVYKLENLDELDHNFHHHGQEIKTETGFDTNICCQIPNTFVESIVKLEDGEGVSENVTFEIHTVESNSTDVIDNETEFENKKNLDLNDNAREKSKIPKLNIKKKIKRIASEGSDVPTQGVQYPCTHCPKRSASTLPCKCENDNNNRRKQQRAERERERRRRIRENPEKWQLQKEKEKQRYSKKKEKKIIKLIKDMNAQEKQQQREKWKEHAKNSRKNRALQLQQLYQQAENEINETTNYALAINNEVPEVPNSEMATIKEKRKVRSAKSIERRRRIQDITPDIQQVQRNK